LSADERFKQPFTAIEQIPDRPDRTLIHIHGVVRAQEPGRSVTIRDETGQIMLHSVQLRALAVGETIEAVGWTSHGAESIVERALFRRSSQPLPAPGKQARLRLAEDVRELSPDEAGQSHPVRLDGVVTWANPSADFFFLRDASGGACVYFPPDASVRLMPGVRVRVQGVTATGRFTAVVMADRISRMSSIDVPPPKPVTLEQALTGVEQDQWVSLSGFVHEVAADGPWSRLTLSTSAGDFIVRAPSDGTYDNLVGSVVTVTGVCDAITNARRQLTGIQIWLPSQQFVQVDEPAPADPFSVPSRSIAALRQFNALQLINRRVRIAGDVVNRPLNGVAQIQDGSETLRVISRESLHFAPGDRIEAVGFAGQEDGRLVLRESVCRFMSHGAGPPPLVLTQVSPINSDLAGRLVRLDGRVVDASTREVGVHLLIQAPDGVVEATLPQPDPSLLGLWPRGSRVSVTGVYLVQFDEYRRPDALQLLLRQPSDVVVVARAPWLTVRRVLAIAGILAVALVSGLAWVLALRRRVRQQTTVIHEQVSKEKAARLDAALTRASKLESLGILAGGIAHDFNNLLTVIMGNLSLARLDDASSSETHSLLDQGVEAAKQARGLTQQLLTFAKGGAPVRRSESLDELAREAAAFALHGTKSAREFEFDADLWAADVDRTQIGQVVHNIVINADQAMPEGGQIRIELRNRQVAAGTIPELAAGRYVELIIADNGPGIPAEQLSRIFEPYFTTKPQGSGLGLATVHSIVKRHKGHIAVESERGRGTKFRIWLPAAESAQPKAAEPVAAPQARAGRVLFMDDEAPIRKIAGAVLKRMGMDVVAVADGAAAVKIYEEAMQSEHPFDVVILDLTVPGGMGGTATMAELRRLDPAVKAIASSGYSSDPVMSNHAAYGFSAIVPKPYQVNDLMKAVSGLIRAGAARLEPVPVG
jgi:signal transduction histidine kinase/ActR/RegA family two-component response regulator